MNDETYVLCDFAYCSKSTNEAKGTPCYVSPEVISNDGVSTTASDIFSLGITLYVFFTRIPLDEPNHKNLSKKGDFNNFRLNDIISIPLYFKYFKPKFEILEDFVSPKMVKLIESMTNLNPAKRQTGEKILQMLECW